MTRTPSKNRISRRTVLQGAAAGSAVLAAPSILTAQSAKKFTRKNLMDPAAAKDVESYRRGVAAMMKLPPDHPHNWYRNAVVHLMDCPHGNWWFFVWHRGYLGYFEQIIRKHSGDPDFALPYWDWTTEPRIPPSFFSDPSSINPTLADNALDPTSNHFEAEINSFTAKYKPAIRDLWKHLTTPQRVQEKIRKNTSFKVFWDGIHQLQYGLVDNFSTPRADNRSIKSNKPDLKGLAAQYVQKTYIEAGLRAEIFTTIGGENPRVGFNSGESKTHHGGVGAAILEGLPHNNVHNNIGGIMPTNLSSIDPIFFMHHCNIDRLWDVWTRRQMAGGRSPLPTAAEAPRFYQEPFLFFVDVNGKKVLSKTTARDYMGMERWGYGYTAGTGTDLIKTPTLMASIQNAPSSTVSKDTFSKGVAGTAAVALTNEFAKTFTAAPGERRQIAHISFVPPPHVKGLRFDFFVTPEGQRTNFAFDSRNLAGSFEFFGMAHAHKMPFSVALDITETLDWLKSTDQLKGGASLRFDVVAADAGGAVVVTDGRLLEGQLKSVSLESI